MVPIQVLEVYNENDPEMVPQAGELQMAIQVPKTR
jgi:hypothetical protein